MIRSSYVLNVIIFYPLHFNHANQISNFIAFPVLRLCKGLCVFVVVVVVVEFDVVVVVVVIFVGVVVVVAAVIVNDVVVHYGHCS